MYNYVKNDVFVQWITKYNCFQYVALQSIQDIRLDGRCNIDGETGFALQDLHQSDYLLVNENFFVVHCSDN